jgi:hypothetical protein
MPEPELIAAQPESCKPRAVMGRNSDTVTGLCNAPTILTPLGFSKREAGIIIAAVKTGSNNVGVES